MNMYGVNLYEYLFVKNSKVLKTVGKDTRIEQCPRVSIEDYCCQMSKQQMMKVIILSNKMTLVSNSYLRYAH